MIRREAREWPQAARSVASTAEETKPKRREPKRTNARDTRERTGQPTQTPGTRPCRNPDGEGEGTRTGGEKRGGLRRPPDAPEGRHDHGGGSAADRATPKRTAHTREAEAGEG